ncbi:ATP-binding cassette domain-containing protein [Paenibacillus sp. LMG 31456]|uniref:ATP-binding cassette domain-containing protein n=1 Tax=Paenibacillus foliorum TaxID=2654974 RepID=A0A972GSX0_9BACL|nr:ABC transporter ATP-binding protein [Paenibacillus foliorum]NOU96289.1 ATP-binding cassette domain-containing protein [Paenibacillus foliorum]
MSIGVSVSGLRLKFAGSSTLQFEELSFAVPTGQKVLLLGPSGCGKSTLLQVLTGLIPGAIDVPVRFDSIVVPPSWGYVFQDPDTQFCMPFVDEEMAFVLENLGVPRDEMPVRIKEGLQQVGLELEEQHMPIQSMSQGMKQRLAIASILALEPEALFLDEPTALLDPEGTKQVWETIKKVGKDKTVVIVEHKIDEVIEFVDRIVLFNHAGAVMADGSPSQIFAECKAELQQYGIWYPGVWEDYAASPVYQALQDNRSKLIADADKATADTAKQLGSEQADASRDLLQLRDFAGYHSRARSREAKIRVADTRLSPGEWVAVIGGNGAGKSTLLQSLMQLLPTSGGYEIIGRSVKGFKDVADEAAYVFQNPEMQFVTNSVYDEAAFGFRRDGQADAAKLTEELLFEFGLQDQKAQHPYQLSLGQKRRLSVATAMSKRQRLVLLDEPTFGQDAANTFAILQKLEGWRQQGVSIIMVTHDMEIVRYFATRVWFIENGRLTLDTEPNEYLRSVEIDGDVGDLEPTGIFF